MKLRTRLVKPGQVAPAFELSALDGGRRTLDGLLADGPVLLAFFKTSCPVCQFTFPYLERMAGNGKLRFVGISQDEQASTRKYNERFSVTFATLLDQEESGYAASNAFGISYVPTLVLVEQDRRVLLVVEGFSKKHMVEIGERAGVSPFRSGEEVPNSKAG